jgi:hypothetical protein
MPLRSVPDRGVPEQFSLDDASPVVPRMPRSFYELFLDENNCNSDDMSPGRLVPDRCVLTPNDRDELSHHFDKKQYS